MTFNHYLPPKTMAFIVKLGDENNLSWKEVERILLNKLAFELGMVCIHRRIGYSKTDHKPYCKDCWTRFQQFKEREYSPETKHWRTVDRLVPIDTFLDELECKNDLQVHGGGQITPADRNQYV